MELTKELLAEWISRFYEKIQNNKGYLSDLDAAIGDGDHGNNMARGMQAVTESLEKNETADTTQSLKLIAMALISKVGGASGPLSRNGQSKQRYQRSRRTLAKGAFGHRKARRSTTKRQDDG